MARRRRVLLCLPAGTVGPAAGSLGTAALVKSPAQAAAQADTAHPRPATTPAPRTSQLAKAAADPPLTVSR